MSTISKRARMNTDGRRWAKFTTQTDAQCRAYGIAGADAAAAAIVLTRRYVADSGGHMAPQLRRYFREGVRAQLAETAQ